MKSFTSQAGEATLLRRAEPTVCAEKMNFEAFFSHHLLVLFCSFSLQRIPLCLRCVGMLSDLDESKPRSSCPT